MTKKAIKVEGGYIRKEYSDPSKPGKPTIAYVWYKKLPKGYNKFDMVG